MLLTELWALDQPLEEKHPASGLATNMTNMERWPGTEEARSLTDEV